MLFFTQAVLEGQRGRPTCARKLTDILVFGVWWLLRVTTAGARAYSCFTQAVGRETARGINMGAREQSDILCLEFGG
jgi:hypothetical protein